MAKAQWHEDWGKPEEDPIYSRDRFYTEAYGRADSQSEIRVHVPPRLRDRLRGAIAEHPIYRGNVSAFIRDAIYHRLHDVAEMGTAGKAIREALAVVEIQARLGERERWIADRESILEQLKAQKGKCQTLEEMRDFGRMLEDLITQVQAEWPEWIRGGMLAKLDEFRTS